jgi:hypothetical protein
MEPEMLDLPSYISILTQDHNPPETVVRLTRDIHLYNILTIEGIGTVGQIYNFLGEKSRDKERKPKPTSAFPFFLLDWLHEFNTLQG